MTCVKHISNKNLTAVRTNYFSVECLADMESLQHSDSTNPSKLLYRIWMVKQNPHVLCSPVKAGHSLEYANHAMKDADELANSTL